MQPVLVIFTCDVESLLVNSGSITLPNYRPLSLDDTVWGRIDSSCEEFGIPLIIRQLENRNMKGTFYLSSLQKSYYGEEAMAEVAHYIDGRGHEVGVHVHCAWKGFQKCRRYDTEEGFHLRDSIGLYDEKKQREILVEAINNIESWTGKKPVSFRAGNYGANLTTLRILGELGIKVDSSRNAAVNSLNDINTCNAALNTEGILEVPLTAFSALRKPIKKLRFIDPINITFSTAKRVLDQVVQMNIGTLVMITHSFQYILPGHVLKKDISPRKHLIQRVNRILDLIEQDDRFQSCTMRELSEMDYHLIRRSDGLPRLPILTTVAGIAQYAYDNLKLN